MKNVLTNFSLALACTSGKHKTLLCSVIISLILISPFNALAQTPQYYIGGGTSGNSWPFNSTSQKTEHHWWGGEFTGAYYGFITKIYFRPSSSASGVFNNFNIKLAQTVGTSGFSGTTYWTPVTTVFTSAAYSMTTTAGNWYGFNLTSPFMYDPSKSLIVQLCFDSKTGTGCTLYMLSVGSSPPSRRIYLSGTNCASTSGAGPDVSRYDFGFDESPAYATDAGISALLAPIAFCPGNYDVKVNLKNYGTSTLNSVTVQWKWDGILQSPIYLSSLGLASMGNYTVTLGSKSFVSGVSHSLEAWTEDPNGITDPNTANDLLTTSLKPALGGTFSIGTGGDYSSFSAAVTDLAANGVCSSVLFNVLPGTYTEQVTIPQIDGASATNTITFDGGVGNASSRILQYNTSSTNDFVVKLNGADYIRFKNLTVSATGSSYGYTFHLTNQANYNQITDCIINAPASSSSYAIGILAAGSTYSTYDNSANNTLIQNNTVNGGYYGIMFRGISSSYCSNNKILDNTVQDFYYYGTYFYYQSGTTIYHNTITQKFTGSPVSNYGYGIYAYYLDLAPVIEQNKVTVASYVLYLYYLNQSNVSRGKIINNSFIAQSNYTSATNYGIYTYYPYSMDVFDNSVSTNTLTGTAYVMRFYYGSGNDIRNNSVGHFGTSGTGYLLYAYPSSTITTLDYNNYYSTSTASDKYYFNGSSYSDLASFQAGYPAYNVNSVSGNTYYYNNKSDLHSNSHVGYQAGTPIPGVTTDFDNQARDPLTPCIGVDEYPQPPPEKDIAVTTALIDYVPERWSRNETIDHEIIATIQNVGLENNPNLVTLVYKEGSAPANSLDGVSETFSPSWFGNQATLTFTTLYNPASQGLHTIYIRVFYPGDGDGSNDLASNTQNAQATTVFGFEDYMNVIIPGFSPGWLVNDANGGNTWGSTSGFGIGGSNAMTYPGDIMPADDWVFTPGATLLENSSYRLKFKYRSRSGGTQTLKVYWGTAQNPLDMLSDPMRNFYTVTFNNSGFVDAILPGIGVAPYFNTPNATQTYYVGFRIISPSGSGATDIDDVILDENPVPPPKIGYGPQGTPKGQHIDTQNSEVLLSAAYKQSAPVSKTFEVVNTTYIYGTNGDFLWNATSSESWLKFSHDTPDPTTFLPANPFNPPWPRQGQKFTMTADPIGLAPGTYYATLTFVAKLYNLVYPNGVDATNQPFIVIVKLTVSAGVGPSASFSDTRTNMVPSNPYFFRDPNNFIFVSVVVNIGTIPSMTITCYPNQMPPGIARNRYVKRYWQIAATGRDWMATIDFYYTGSEAYAGGVNTPVRLATLRGIRQPILGGAWEDPIMGTTSISYPPDYFVRVFGIASTPVENFTGNIALATNWWPKEGGEFSALPTEYKLNEIHPNPLTSGLSDAASIGYALPEESSVRLILYNNLGVEIETFVDEVKPAGYYSVQFNASDLPAGIYYYRFLTPNFTETKRMVVIK